MVEQEAFTRELAHRAVVSRSQAANAEQYLILQANGAAAWTDDPAVATTFPSMREAARMALRLPSQLRAFGLLKDVEVDAHRQLH